MVNVIPATHGRSKKNNTVDVNAPISNELGKMPPNDVKLEQVVLGAILIESDAYGSVSDHLKVDCFYDPRHRLIYQAMADLASKNQPIDMLTVSEQLHLNGTSDQVGGEYYVTSLASLVGSAANLEYHTHMLETKFLARQLISFATNVEKQAYDQQSDVEEVMQQAEGRLFEISQRNMKKDYTLIRPLVSEALKRIQDASNSEGMIGVPSGFTELDKITSGWHGSDLVIIAARPAMGKTAFVLSMARNMAEAGHPVAVFSLEMSNLQLVNRLLVNVSELPGDKIRNGRLEEYEWKQLNERAKILDDMPIYLDDTPSLSMFEFNTKARRLVHDNHVECIVIDYLQLMNASGSNFGSREQEVSMISRDLKQMAKELDIPIIALSQLNRGVEGRTGEDKRPQLADLRESGAIEQDADMVLFIHRPEYYKILDDGQGNSWVGLALIIIAKHRNGATADVKLRFKSELAKFLNLEGDGQSSGLIESDSSINSYTGDDFVASAQAAEPSNSSEPLAGTASSTPF